VRQGKDSPIQSGNSDGSGAVVSNAPLPPARVQVTTGRDQSFDYAGWNRFNYYIGALFSDFAFLPADEYLWRYAQGDSPLTLDSLAVVMQKPQRASENLLETSEQLDTLVAMYREGRIGQTELAQAIQAQAKSIRSSAKLIRKDAFVNYLDLNQHGEVPDFGNPRTLEELTSLSAELHRTAEAINEGVRGYVQKDMTRVVAADDLRQPSIESLTKRADRIARAIQKFGGTL